ncbi:MAG: glycosyltransferase [Planctomycetota bacterium]|nr:MAG: glycosyltransferase [Planctomycetota bacterium]
MLESPAPLDESLRFSLVVPLYNEEENVAALLAELDEVLPALASQFECLLVDDGSTDGTRELLLAASGERPWLRVLSLRENRGQSTALCAGFDQARAPVLLMMDGDLQNDPRDFDRILRGIESGDWDAVSGIRAKRKDRWIRRVSSKIANRIRNWLTGDHVVDSACGLKGFRRQLFRRMPRFHGMHRFLPTLARMVGGRVTEIDVNHRERHAGTAKYGVSNRALRALRDVFGLRWLRTRLVLYELRAEQETGKGDGES